MCASWKKLVPHWARSPVYYRPPPWVRNWEAHHIKPWKFVGPGVVSRLPEHYIKRKIELISEEPHPVHWEPINKKYSVRDVTTGLAERVQIQNIAIPVFYPEQADQGLWGGEGIVQGYYRKKLRRRSSPKLWKPKVFNFFLYSEILDRWMEIAITQRTLDLIDEALGFDNYILKTHERDLKSQLGNKLKREMLLALVRKSLHPSNPKKREELLEKYKEFIIPEEEAEWVGLTIKEAIIKQLNIEKIQELKNKTPLQDIFVDELVKELQEKNEAGSSELPGGSIFEKFMPFKTPEKPST